MCFVLGNLEWMGESPDELQNVKLQYFNYTSCRRYLWFYKIDDATQMCAGDVTTSKDTCQGKQLE